MRKVRQLLNELAELLPIDGPAHHNITLDNGEIQVAVMAGGKWVVFSLEESDLDDDPKEMAADMAIDARIATGEGECEVNDE